MKNLRKFDEFIAEKKEACDKKDAKKCGSPKGLKPEPDATKEKKDKKIQENLSTGKKLAFDIQEYFASEDFKYSPVDVRSFFIDNNEVIDVVFTDVKKIELEVFADEIALEDYFDFDAERDIFYKDGETVLRYTLTE
jgi:hypothetical protein